jgi:hypothetical protein
MYLLIEGPEREQESVPRIDTRFHSGLETRRGALEFSKPSSNLELGLEPVIPGDCHSGEDVARQQSQRELVRILQDSCIGDCQAEPRGDLRGRTHSAYNV